MILELVPLLFRFDEKGREECLGALLDPNELAGVQTGNNMPVGGSIRMTLCTTQPSVNKVSYADQRFGLTLVSDFIRATWENKQANRDAKILAMDAALRDENYPGFMTEVQKKAARAG